jgi:GNAT superfamily N-acetyltransferase
VSGRRSSVFCGEDLAARIEGAEAEFMVACVEQVRRRHGIGTFARPVGGGFATYAGPDSPFNKVAGLGFGPPSTDDELAAIEAAYASEGAPVQVEISALADPDLGVTLTGRGYRLVSFENVLGRPLGEDLGAVTVADVVVSRVDGPQQAWLDVVVDAVDEPDTAGLAQHESFPREVVERAEVAMADAGARLYLATREGSVAGGAGFRDAEGLAQMTGAATAPAHRRHGVHRALLDARLHDAVSAGCDFAVVTTQPGSPSHANTQRLGFDLLYTRAVLVKDR